MQLLLFLSALLAGLTGVITGDVRTVQRQGDAAITRAADAVAEATVNVTAVQPVSPFVGQTIAVTAFFAIHEAPAGRPARLTSERRLE